MPIEWTHCPQSFSQELLSWFEVRGWILNVLFNPWLLSFITGLLLAGFFLLLPLSMRLRTRGLILITAVVLVNVIYSPWVTDWLSGWLSSQVPSTIERAEGDYPSVAVLLGRGPKIARATTAEAARLLKSQLVAAVYVPGDQPSTAQRLLSLGVPPERVAGDSCARTTWENATLTTLWLQSHHPGAAVLLITDPWQLPRATAAFRRQGLVVKPISAEPVLSPSNRNRLALRETLGTLLYRLQGRM